MNTFFQGKRILVIASHPDDEVLGMGASIHKFTKELGCHVKVVILGEGITSRDAVRSAELRKDDLSVHRNCIEKARNILGYQEIAIHDLPDNRFDSIALLDIVKVIEEHVKAFRPEIIFTHSSVDLNIDHRRTFEAVITATRPMVHSPTKGIFSFYVPSATDWSFGITGRQFNHQIAVELTPDNVKAKTDAMKAYDFETRPFPHPRSEQALKTLAESLGPSHGLKAAETFELIRYSGL